MEALLSTGVVTLVTLWHSQEQEHEREHEHDFACRMSLGSLWIAGFRRGLTCEIVGGEQLQTLPLSLSQAPDGSVRAAWRRIRR